MKNLTSNPWEFADKRFPVWLIVKGSVTTEYAWNDGEAALKKRS